MEAKIGVCQKKRRQEDMVKYIEFRSSKIKANNLHSQFNTMVLISDLDKSSFSEVGESKTGSHRGQRVMGTEHVFRKLP